MHNLKCLQLPYGERRQVYTVVIMGGFAVCNFSVHALNSLVHVIETSHVEVCEVLLRPGAAEGLQFMSAVDFWVRGLVVDVLLPPPPPPPEPPRALARSPFTTSLATGSGSLCTST